MTNHTQSSIELMVEVDNLRGELARTYREQNLGNPGNHARRIADLHQRINVSLKLADTHATHSLRQAIEDFTTQAEVQHREQLEAQARRVAILR